MAGATIAWLDEYVDAALAHVREVRSRGSYPFFREMERGGLRTTVDGRALLNFSSNDYLGLTMDPAVLDAAHKALDRFGMGLSSSRLQAHTVAHAALERRLAHFFGFEQALITTTGYQAVLSVLTALADERVTLALDSLAHASILEGAFAAAGAPGHGAELRFFAHNSARGLERVLGTRGRQRAIVVAEGIYSLDGDMAPVAELLEVCHQHQAALVVDDAHGFGTLGAHGRGTLEHLGLEGRVPLVVTTFSKTLGGIGGVILGSANVVELIRHAARAFLFSASLPVPVVAVADAVLDRLEAEGPRLVAELHQKSARLRGRLTALGVDLGGSQAHIMPVLLRNETLALTMHFALYERGFYLVPITYPAVRRGQERLRLNVTNGHTYTELDALADDLEACGAGNVSATKEPITEPAS
jgi:glycine C-acetyltransferase